MGSVKGDVTPESNRTKDMLTIEVDLKTEVGSRTGRDDDDDDVKLTADGDHVSIPVHSDFSSVRGEMTHEEVKRDLARCMAEHLVQAALLAGSRDNISVMVVTFPGCGV